MPAYLRRVDQPLHGAEHRRRPQHRDAMAWNNADWIRNLLTMPLIYSLLVPFAILDVWVSAYQWVCFPLYRVARVRRGQYFVMDRHRLPYLTALERANCTFCSYANGVIAYVREIAARTEQYWCPIKHRDRVTGFHDRYRRFAAYSDADAYRHALPRLRHDLRPRHDVAADLGQGAHPSCGAGVDQRGVRGPEERNGGRTDGARPAGGITAAG